MLLFFDNEINNAGAINFQIIVKNIKGSNEASTCAPCVKLSLDANLKEMIEIYKLEKPLEIKI